MTYSNGFGIIIPDKMTISVTSWHHMDTQFVLDTRLLETRLLIETDNFEFLLLHSTV